MTYEQRIRQELERVCGTEEWICLHCSPENASAFEVVLVTRVGSETVSAHSFSTTGRPSGSRSITFEDILGITTGGYYLENLKILRDTLPESIHVPLDGAGHDGLLRVAQERGLVVSVRLEDETVQGFVREVGEDWTAIAEIHEEEGGDGGVRIVSLEAAERVFVGGEDEMRLATLFRARQMRDSIG
ncbi:hypothetical protein EON77_02225 [bacterium]|nr:MAG: hypothetical protein EON77_02225 [bacterium]